LIAIPFVFFGIVFAENCADFPAHGDFGSKCIFLPLKEMRKGVYEACHINYNHTLLEHLPAPSIMPKDFKAPDKCGRCAFKAQCRSRAKQDGCFRWDLNTKGCGVGDSDDCANCDKACELPKLPEVDCEWGVVRGALMQCVDSKEHVPDWTREGWKKLVSAIPKPRCVEKDGKCHCCCHPYHPDDLGNCVEDPQEQCGEYAAWNDWSQTCLWYPFHDMAKSFKDHCAIDYEPPENLMNMLKEKPATPEGLKMPEKCGFCSFKVRCRKRERKEGCFFLDVDRKPCGHDDCETCGSPCAMPKIENGCDWHKHLSGKILTKVKEVMHKSAAEGKKLPFWKKAGLMKVLNAVPHGKCIEHNDQCHCCCHPYEAVVTPNGVECKAKPICATASLEEE